MAASDTAFNPSRLKILVVEDEAIVANDIKDILVGFDYGTIDIAVSGEEAITQFRAARHDLVLMDIKLKGHMDGIQAAEAIRSFSSVPILYLTSYAHHGIVQRVKNTAPCRYLVKPFDARELHSNIEMALCNAQAQSTK